MTSANVIAVVVSLLAACSFGVAAALQHQQAHQVDGGGTVRAGLLAGLLRQPRWLASIAAAAVAAIALAELAFALDSIPAIFGLTREPYLVFTPNMFALPGLRHLYFLTGGLLGQLAPLAAGLAAILGFIGVKLVTTALRESGVSQLGPVPVPHISTGVSLAVIAGVIAAVVVTSLLVGGRRTQPEGPATVAGPHRGGQS
jgi:predicted tellurium resistance membrane protein TerC